MTASERGPERGYVICSEQRTGSTLLCEWLESTGVLGHPREVFERVERAIALERDPSRLDAILAEAATPNGVWGIKLFPYQFDATMKARWIGRLPRPRFVHLARRDLLGQAISLVRARQTRQFFAHEPSHAAPRYDVRAIRRQLARLAEADARWRRYAARNGLDVLWLTYEEMIADPQATVSAVAAHVGVAAPALRPDQAKVAVQRDALSDEWRARFVAEAGDLDRLDHPLGRPRVWARRLVRDARYLIERLAGARKPRIDHSKTG